MGRLKRVRDEWFDNFHWLKFALRVVLIFVFVFAGSLYLLVVKDRVMDWVDLLISLLAAVFVSSWVAESFIANPKKLGWDYGRLRPGAGAMQPLKPTEPPTSAEGENNV